VSGEGKEASAPHTRRCACSTTHLLVVRSPARPRARALPSLPPSPLRRSFFRNDPTAGRSFSWDEQQLILGESLSQWGEQCDASNIESRMWPRACGGAERMWSAPCGANATCSDADVSAAEPRLEAQRCRMLRRGVRAGPLRPSSEYFYCALPTGSM